MGEESSVGQRSHFILIFIVKQHITVDNSYVLLYTVNNKGGVR